MAFALLLTYTVFLLLRPQDFLPAFAGAPYMMLSLGGAFVIALLRKQLRWQDTPTVAIGGLLLAMIASQVVRGWLGGISAVLGSFGPVVATYLIYAGVLRDGQRIQTLSTVIVACTSIIVWHSLGQASTGVGWTGATTLQGNRVTWVGIFNDPNDLGLLLLVAVPMLVMRATLARGSLARYFWYLLAGLHVYGIWLTQSRGALLSLLLLAGIAFWRRYGLGRSLLLALLLSPLLLLMLANMREIDSEEASAYGRINAWYVGLQLFRAQPLFGVGMDAFTEHHHLTAHNSYVLVLAELGAFGYLFWSLLISASLLMVWRVANRRGVSGEPARSTDTGTALPDKAFAALAPQAAINSTRAEATMVLYALIGYLSASFFLSRSYIILLYMLCGLAVATFYKAQNEHPELLGVTLRSLILFILLMLPASVIGLYLMVKILI